MDIEYLLMLQNFRELTNNLLTPFMCLVSDFAMTWLLVIPVFIYWSISKRSGLFVMLSFGFSRMIDTTIKLVFRVQRPFIRDPRIIPAERPGGYSFPSGHVMAAAPIYGAIAAISSFKTRARAILSWLCILLIILTAFSRNYLGVHTPQDVIVGTILGLGSVVK